MSHAAEFKIAVIFSILSCLVSQICSSFKNINLTFFGKIKLAFGMGAFGVLISKNQTVF